MKFPFFDGSDILDMKKGADGVWCHQRPRTPTPASSSASDMVFVDELVEIAPITLEYLRARLARGTTSFP